jgi:hypothetical protein
MTTHVYPLLVPSILSRIGRGFTHLCASLFYRAFKQDEQPEPAAEKNHSLVSLPRSAKSWEQEQTPKNAKPLYILEIDMCRPSRDEKLLSRDLKHILKHMHLE